MSRLSLLLLLLTLNASAQPRFVDVFTKHTEGYRNYRIPSLIRTRSGILIAFAEGRKSLQDQSENDIVMKRSTDGGKTWEGLLVIDDDGKNALNNPQAVVREDGRILLMYQRYADGFGERRAMPGMEGNSICRTFLTYSDDEGRTWSVRKDMTNEVKRPEAVSVACGPGIGIQLTGNNHNGRLIMPFNQGTGQHWAVYAVYSDDGGDHWTKGPLAPLKRKVRGWANELQMVELSDGRLMLNARSKQGNHKRKVGYSKDGGETWSELIDQKELLEPECQGSLLRCQFKGHVPVILFCNPRNRTRRIRGTVQASTDNGSSWNYRSIIYKGGFGYSCLAQMSDDLIGVLFEKDGYNTISFTTLNLPELISHPNR